MAFTNIPTYTWLSPVASLADLPTSANLGDVRVVTDLSALYYYNSSAWVSVSGGGGGGITGSGAAGQVSYWNGTTSQSGDNNLFWDVTNSRLGIGTTTPTQSIDITFSNVSSTPLGFRVQNTNISGATGFTIDNNNLSASITQASYGSGFPNAYYVGQSSLSAKTGLIFACDASVSSGGTNSIRFLTGGFNSTQERMRISSTGSVGIGTISPAFLLDILGSATSSPTANFQVVGGTGGASGGIRMGSIASGYGGMWAAGVTPSGSNYTLSMNGSDTSVNTTTQGALLVNSSTRSLNWSSTGVTIGTNTFVAQFAVINQLSTRVASIVRGIASQTANLTEWQNSAGTVLASVNQSGVISIGSSVTNPNSGALVLSTNGGQFFLERTTGALNEKLWDILNDGNVLRWRAVNDANNFATNYFEIRRTTTTINSVCFPNGNIGIGTSDPTNILSLGNASARKIWIENVASDVSGRALTIAAGSSIAGTTLNDRFGGNLILQSGLGTGAGESTISFQTGTTAASSMTVQSYSTKMTIIGNGNVGIGTDNPTHALTFPTASSGVVLYNTADQTTNWERLIGRWTSNTFVLGTDFAGTATTRMLRLGVAATNVSGINRTLDIQSSMPFFSYAFGGTGLAGYTVDMGGNQALSASAGTQGSLSITPTITQTSTAGYKCLFISPFISTSGSGSNHLMDLGTNSAAAGGGTHTSRFLVDNSGNVAMGGKIFLSATNTASGVTGAQTINKSSGTVNFAAGATSLVVTNAFSVTTSIVYAVIRTNDTTAVIKNVVPAAGSFTINLTVAATAETSVGFVVFN